MTAGLSTAVDAFGSDVDKDSDEEERLARLNVAERQFQQGLQAIKDDRLEDAVTLLCMCLEARVDIFGAAAPECASAYYRYGAALLYSVQDSADVFGGDLQTAAQQHDNQMGQGDVESAAVEHPPSSSAGPAASGAAAEALTAVEEDEEEEGEREGRGRTQATSEAGAVPSDVQLAWENLETAKGIYARQGASCTMELADVVMLLGDLSAEDDAFERALPDYRHALSLLKALPEGKPAPIQRLAEVHFKASLALQFMNRIPEALTETRDAIALCQERLSVLRKADAAAAATHANAAAGAQGAAADQAKSAPPAVAACGGASDGTQDGRAPILPAQLALADPGQVQGSWGAPIGAEGGGLREGCSTTEGSMCGGGSARLQQSQSAAEAEAARLTDSLEGLQERVVELQERLREDEATRAQLKTAYTSAMAAVRGAPAPIPSASPPAPLTTPATSAALSSAATSAHGMTMAAPSAQPIQDLGVVGRGGKRRLTPLPLGTPYVAPPNKRVKELPEASCLTHLTAKIDNS